ncbi:MAG TPA: group II intron reverse transcriptase/maturase [Anaerolineales bacterium]|nr:group II intron reverse transcriptase/maturase [Anaerolineales bacterium]
MHGNSENTYTKRQRIAEAAKRNREMAFTSLNQLLTPELLFEAFRKTSTDAAPGVDGQTAADYDADLIPNLRSLVERAKSGTYVAPPVRRVHIPKGTGPETRPIGIPTLEDKVLQRGVAMILEPLYEPIFHPGSYGFRPGRSAHQALESLWKQSMDTGGGWMLDVDIRKFFDTLDHGCLRELLRRRVRDGVLLRLIDKWLKAGVLEDGAVSYPDEGTPQGGVISPLLANIYLHYVLDAWIEEEVAPRLRGRVFLIRYADDFVLGFTCEADARQVLAELPRRFAEHGLTIHPDKTRLVRFRPRPKSRDRSHSDVPDTFDFLGFTHFWGRTRKGGWAVKRKTASNRITRTLRAVSEWCRKNRHLPVAQQHAMLVRKLRGHFAYYGITGNSAALSRVLHFVTRLWKKWLGRRNRERRWTWARHRQMLEHYPLPPPVPVHSVLRHVANP